MECVLFDRVGDSRVLSLGDVICIPGGDHAYGEVCAGGGELRVSVKGDVDFDSLERRGIQVWHRPLHTREVGKGWGFVSSVTSILTYSKGGEFKCDIDLHTLERELASLSIFTPSRSREGLRVSFKCDVDFNVLERRGIQVWLRPLHTREVGLRVSIKCDISEWIVYDFLQSYFLPDSYTQMCVGVCFGYYSIVQFGYSYLYFFYIHPLYHYFRTYILLLIIYLSNYSFTYSLYSHFGIHFDYY